MEGADLLTQDVDKTQLPPLHQKRILAFVNHFLITSCNFLNDFSLQCESKFIEIERKLQKVEAALCILEAKLASIPDVENKESQETVNVESTIPSELDDRKTDKPVNETAEIETPTVKGIPAAEHDLYKKFFKMLQVGVPLQAVQLKMQSEGMDSNILSNPQAIIPVEHTNDS
ncbi:WASH complex subunit 3 [Stomoxys calcitrans]|uniref:WASH complex subunit 3 n=1 Tax=Stomoxys calcitrans TaxID=35570 RepID=A0A1I8P6U7_STOCA|nr:WASH complex subunit 3 [Stomoxys calcitrans]